MQPDQLIEALSRTDAFPFAVETVEVRQTHISIVFLAGDFAYKVKKAVDLGFLDFSTLEKRRYFCEEEVRLNRRLAPDVYLGVVPIVRSPGGLRFEAEGDVVEWAVKMRRLPDEATLTYRLQHGTIDDDTVCQLAERIAQFHAQAASGGRIAAFGRFEVVAGNARENFAQSAALVGDVVSRAVFDRVRELTERQLRALEPLIEARAAAGKTRDTHGDLRLDHVYFFPEAEPIHRIVILDCIEFNERFRFADPIADMAFLVMDLLYHGQRRLARLFTRAYLAAAGDDEGAPLVPFYTAYRAVVRAKVEGMKARESEVPAAEREEARRQSRAHWLLALAELEEPARRPCLLLVGGLPGTGKSTLARYLAEHAGFAVIRSDVIRKELAGLSPAAGLPAPREDIYTPEWTERTYRTCLERAASLLNDGQRVLVDATFREERFRRLFLDAARAWGVPALFLHCRVAETIARRRLEQRKGDVSDADWQVYLQLAKAWEPPGPQTLTLTSDIDGGAAPAEVAQAAQEVLRRHELF